MGFLAKIFNMDEPPHPAEINAFGRTGRGSGRVAEAWAKQGGSGRGKSIAQQRKEHLAAQKKSKKW
jgi:hypothetical protein